MTTTNSENSTIGGFLLVHKPIGITSHDVVAKLRRITGVKKIGHSGTLDPFAEGLLIVAIGREYTKKIDNFVKKDKTYVAGVKLGQETDTYDITGQVIKSSDQIISIEEIMRVLPQFEGEQLQTPPMFSAKKINGKKLYELARQGKEIHREPNKINVYSIKILDFSFPLLELEIDVSSGTYIRSLAHDIGKKLGCGACLQTLIRTRIHEFDLKSALKLEDINMDNWKTQLFS